MSKFANSPIVVPVDFSEETDRALDYALDMASDPSLVHAVHVAPSTVLYEGGAVCNTSRDASRTQLTAAFRERLTDSRYAAVQFDVRFGDLGDEILNCAEDLHAGLIVIPSHQRSGLAHLLLGSVSDRVVRHASCPVLVLRA
jgi:universal stress protein A